jgi:hypothetical protein
MIVIFIIIVVIGIIIFSVNTFSDTEKIENKIQESDIIVPTKPVYKPLFKKIYGEDEFQINLAGTYYLSERAINEVNNLSFNDELYLKREKNNPVDKNAIKVITSDDVRIGYIPANMVTQFFDSEGDIRLNDCYFYESDDLDKPHVTIAIRFFEYERINDLE